MRLAASYMPSQPAGNFTGRVHSVFRRVVNLSLDDGELLTLYAGDSAGEPPGVVALDAPVHLDFVRHIAHQATVSCRGGVLRFAGSDLSVALRRSRPHERVAVAAAKSPPAPGFAARWRAAWRCLRAPERLIGLTVALNGRRPAGSLDAALAARARNAVPRLLGATRERDIDAAVSAAARLVGAGPGLTPSGDDFLAGFLVGLRHASESDPMRRFADALGPALAPLYAGSGEISRNALAHAAAGRIARPLDQLARAIVRGVGATPIGAATVAAMHIGHSSGADATFGLLCGLAAGRAELAGIAAAALGETPARA